MAKMWTRSRFSWEPKLGNAICEAIDGSPKAHSPWTSLHVASALPSRAHWTTRALRQITFRTRLRRRQIAAGRRQTFFSLQRRACKAAHKFCSVLRRACKASRARRHFHRALRHAFSRKAGAPDSAEDHGWQTPHERAFTQPLPAALNQPARQGTPLCAHAYADAGSEPVTDANFADPEPTLGCFTHAPPLRTRTAPRFLTRSRRDQIDSHARTVF